MCSWQSKFYHSMCDAMQLDIGEHPSLMMPTEHCRCGPHVSGTLAWMEPPRDTMPVTRSAVSGMCRSSTPAWMVK